jgi:hypothetical protein
VKWWFGRRDNREAGQFSNQTSTDQKHELTSIWTGSRQSQLLEIARCHTSAGSMESILILTEFPVLRKRGFPDNPCGSHDSQKTSLPLLVIDCINESVTRGRFVFCMGMPSMKRCADGEWCRNSELQCHWTVQCYQSRPVDQIPNFNPKTVCPKSLLSQSISDSLSCAVLFSPVIGMSGGIAFVRHSLQVRRLHERKNHD